MTSLLPLKWAASLLVAVSAFGLCTSLIGAPEYALPRLWRDYCDYLDLRFRRLFMPALGPRIASAQTMLLAVVVVISVAAAKSAGPLLLLPVVATAPAVVLELQLRRRRLAIESTLDRVALALANALRSTPSLGKALSHVQAQLPRPMNDEVRLTLTEMRLGSSLERALRDMGKRIGSVPLDSVISGMLIARQTGGNVIRTLETLATTLREMARLEGSLRTKTAGTKTQLWVLGLFPAFVLLLFDLVSPGYFAPLVATPVGYVVIVIALALWAFALMLARKVLGVAL